MPITTIGLDLAKHVFQVHGIAADGGVVIRRRLRRAEVIKFFSAISPCLIGMEACSSAHHWARELMALGHEVRLMPPIYVKPYVKRGKNDTSDAVAICEAVTRPTMRFVPVKSAEQQSVLMLHRTRDLLIRQRTMLANSLRAHCAEFGLVVAQGMAKLAELLARIADEASGGKDRLGGISKQGDRYIRRLLISGAHAVLQYARQARPGSSPWATGLLQRRPFKLVAVALANKMARIAWAVLARGENDRTMPKTCNA